MSIKLLTPESAQPRAGEILQMINKKFGMIPNVYSALANSPEALAGFLSFDEGTKTSTLPRKFLEQIALAVSAYNECEYCKRAHFFVGKNLGVRQEELRLNLQSGSGDPRVQAAISFSLEVLSNKGHVSEHTMGATNEVFSAEEIVLIFSVVMCTSFTNYFNHLAQTPIDFPKMD